MLAANCMHCFASLASHNRAAANLRGLSVAEVETLLGPFISEQVAQDPRTTELNLPKSCRSTTCKRTRKVTETLTDFDCPISPNKLYRDRITLRGTSQHHISQDTITSCCMTSDQRHNTTRYMAIHRTRQLSSIAENS